MKVLLLNPPGAYCRAGSRWPHRRPPKRVGIDYHPFPFALGYAASRLRADGHEPLVLDCIAEGIGPEALSARVAAFGPDVALMETSAPSFFEDAAVAQDLGVPCIAGGAHATATVADHLEAGFAGVVRGEYDQVISEAITLAPAAWLALREDVLAQTGNAGECGSLSRNTPRPSGTPLKGGPLRSGTSRDASSNEYAPRVADLDAIPYPAWDLMPMEKYNDPFCKGRTVTVLTSRGCPLECNFCTIAPHQGKRNYRRRDPEAVCDEIAALIAQYDPDEIYIDDDTITINKKHLIAFCEAYQRRNFGIPFSCMGNVPVDRDGLEAMAAAGCRALKFGVESGDPDVLARIPKRLDLEDVRRTVADCRALGIQTHANFLFGLVGETREKALRSLDYALSLNTHTLQFAIATPYPGTDFYAQAEANGWLTCESWKDFDPAGGAVISYPDYSAADIEAMYRLAWRRWQWHMLTRRPTTLAHHFGNAFRREGVGGLWRIGMYSAERFLKVVAAH